MNIKTLLVMATMLCAEASPAGDEFSLAPLFTDNMVLQQRSRAQLRGTGAPGVVVHVTAQWGSAAETVVAPDGSWILELPTPPAGGPFHVTVQHRDTSVVLRNVLTGEVWLCSGQSNMEMPLAGWPPGDTILNSAREIAGATFPGIRLFTVRRAYAAQPERVCDGSWAECSPTTVSAFSATAYFFGKRVHETLGVPVGLIHASWGGTPVESWLSGRYLSRYPQYDTTLQKLGEGAQGQRILQDWLRRFPVVNMRLRSGETRWVDLDLDDGPCPSRAYDDSRWHIMSLPTLWEKTALGNFDGAVWFRRHVTIPAAWRHKDLELNLGPIDDVDVTYVNGAKVGAHEGEGQWNAGRTYRVPGRLIDSVVVLIAVRVIDYQGGGGIYGDVNQLSLRAEGGDSGLSLAGDWKYLPVAEYAGTSIYVFGSSGNVFDTRPRLAVDLSAQTPSTLYNGMIAPLVPFSIKGVIWYQGETNTHNPGEYRRLFPLLIENWRNDFGAAGAPFYYVQIAPYNYGSSTRAAFLREAQSDALSVENTGMVVTLDIGNPDNIHPANKQEVGGRLAAWALGKTYGKNGAFAGPMFASVTKRTGALAVSFSDAEGGLIMKPGREGTGFQIAGADRVFRDAEARVEGTIVIVSHPDVPIPEAVRYAFANAPAATLFNRNGLPAAPFRTDRWD